MPGPWRRRNAHFGRAAPYKRQVDWITQTQACQTYGLKPADLDAISPIEVARNPHGGRHPMKKYALSQIQALARRLEYEESLEVEIVRTRAIEQYGLTPAAMDMLVPIRTKPNPFKPGTEMRFYNVKDVEKLSEKVKQESDAAAAKYATPLPTASSSSAVAGPSNYAAAGPTYATYATAAPPSAYLLSSSQTQPTASQQTADESDDEYGDGGIDDSLLSQIPLP